jgi:hypothetical protein
MKIETNEKLIRRNARIAQISMIGGLVILVGGMVISFRTTEYFGLSLAALVVGFLFSQVGIYYGNRYGKRPRPDELLNQALKGLDGKYTLYHYLTPAAHLLVGPAGIWILMPKSQRGTITFGRGRWRQSGGGIMASYLKIFAQEGIGRPDLEIQGEVSSIEKFLKSRLDDENLPAINAALVFTNEKVNLQIADSDNPPAITLPLGKLKEHLRKFAKAKPISLDKAQQIQDVILGESS